MLVESYIRYFLSTDERSVLLGEVPIHFLMLFITTFIPSMMKSNLKNVNKALEIFSIKFFGGLLFLCLLFWSVNGIINNIIDSNRGPITREVIINNIEHNSKGFDHVDTDLGGFQLIREIEEVNIHKKYRVKIFTKSEILIVIKQL
ncbi:hypothetical protein [Paenibacillus baekrokdamisoli]|uniref:hypothetical protein n=1 Tax=Paenibacillus baekrokdamisoli TaxID=1712516 RepID=UPI000F79D0F7|nr:hypothetical protein [Paenibacillus baekrokdamisoli]